MVSIENPKLNLMIKLFKNYLEDKQYSQHLEGRFPVFLQYSSHNSKSEGNLDLLTSV